MTCRCKQLTDAEWRVLRGLIDQNMCLKNDVKKIKFPTKKPNKVEVWKKYER